MSPLEFMQRLAALVPPARLHLIRLHGVLAPHAKLRAVIVARPVHTRGFSGGAARHAKKATTGKPANKASTMMRKLRDAVTRNTACRAR